MKFGKKIAQTATEYLIILAVVIIIALIVVGVLGGIPGIGGSTGSGVANAYWQTANIGVDGVKISASSTAADSDVIILKNNNPIDIEIISMSLGDRVILDESNVNLTILKGRTRSISNSTSGSMDLNVTNGQFLTPTCTAKDAFAETLSVTYIDKKTNAKYTVDSDQKLEGECSV